MTFPLSLYIHIPWCIRKCPYCDFNSHRSPDVLPEESYVLALVDDLVADLERFSRRKLQSIFIGGGTPSLFSAKAYSLLFDRLKTLLPFAEDIEITLEANPGSVEQQRFADYRGLGINRLSLGIQSFDSQKLKALGRIHDGVQAHRAIEQARIAGFDNINIDIMHGLPGQSVRQGLSDLETAMKYNPEHLSWYQLTIEPNTVFYKQRPVLPTEIVIDDLEKRGLDFLATNGYKRYEISAFSRDDKKSKHNMNYWLFGDYFGIGAGAHGKLTEDIAYRTRKHRQPTDYLNKDKQFMAELKVLSENDLIFEFMLNTTRLEMAIENKLFTERTGLDFAALEPKLKLAAEQNLVVIGDYSWQVTAHGRNYTNDLQALFL